MPEFVVQEHKADKAGLHYDFRLEEEGHLSSWAVPKGVPTTSGVKRLAIKVADHPFEYKEFEGVIEEGYGKGSVSTWDEGDYLPISEKSGMRLLKLEGSKLKGYYNLLHLDGAKWIIWKRKENS